MIWIDVEDLFDYMRQNARPSGIQRLEYELCRALAGLPEARDQVRFLRRGTAGYYVVPITLVDHHFRDLTSDARPNNPSRPAHAEVQASADRSLPYRLMKKAFDNLPSPMRVTLLKIYFHQRAAILAVGELPYRCLESMRDRRVAARAHWRRTMAASTPPAISSAVAPDGSDFQRDSRPADVLMLLGAPWSPGYAATLENLVRQGHFRLVLMIYDLVPLRRPEWCDNALTRHFTAWTDRMLPLADVLLTISHATAADIERYAAETGTWLRRPPRPIPIGTGFTTRPLIPGSEADDVAQIPPPGRLPPAHSYAMIVSTIEARKNHALMFRVWRRLLDDMPVDAVPTLVFAGHVGWLVVDLMAQLRNTAFLQGKIILIEDPSDAELRTLYQGCCFTLFPSFYEGWGLPVTESLSYGCPCIISSATSLPEAGGTLARYFDPDSVADAYQIVRAVIEDPEGLDAWRERIVREFEPVSWEQSAQDVLRALDPATQLVAGLEAAGSDLVDDLNAADASPNVADS